MDVLLGNGSYNPTAVEAQHGAAYERDLMQWREMPFVVGLKIIAKDDTKCAFAKQYAGHYRLEDAPDYPFGPCEQHKPEYEGFCTCWWTSVMDDENPIEGWKIPDKRHPLAGGRIEVPPEPVTEDSIRALANILNIKSEEHIQGAISNVKRRGELAGTKPALSYRLGRMFGKLIKFLTSK
ncbi:MAG: hypothetical protein Q8O38_07320 [Sulfurimicrobium sp.]|nr:hypothetical protein [Sulfurimicrobium sp.]